MLILAWMVSVVPLFGRADELKIAQFAQGLLGTEVWSRVVKVENTNKRSVYPRTVYALIFEFSDILWFYTPTDGTQSFSLYVKQVEMEKKDLGPRFLAIDPGFARFEIIDAQDAPAKTNQVLPNGCFVESVAALNKRVRDGEPILRAELLLSYLHNRKGGHCVLIYQTPKGVFSLDPTTETVGERVGAVWPSSLRGLAQASWPSEDRGRVENFRVVEASAKPFTDRARLAAANRHSKPFEKEGFVN